jgi:hypothetical protein
MRTRLTRKCLISALAVMGAATGLQAQAASSSSGVGFLMYRVYLPEGGPTKVVLPKLTFSYSDGRPSRTLAPCTTTLGLTAAGLSNLAAGTFTCAWAFTSGGPSPAIGLNIAFPDASALYWVTPLAIDQAATITVNGEFPDARYMSWNAYDASLTTYEINGVKSGLPDFEIAPDAGSVNPWQQSGPAGGHYTLKVSSGGAGQGNVLPMPPSTKGAISLMPAPCSGAACPPINQFLRQSFGGLFPNVDNAYVVALTQPKSGQVVVVRGKMPTSVVGAQSSHPVPWPADGLQTRYTSVCNNVYAWPYPVTNCAADYQLKPDAQGYYTVVASAAKDRPANATDAKGVSWLANSPILASTRHMLIVRNMLPNGFDQAVQNVPVDSTPQAAEAVMQDYYPHVWACAKATFEAGGWQACAK